MSAAGVERDGDGHDRALRRGRAERAPERARERPAEHERGRPRTAEELGADVEPDADARARVEDAHERRRQLERAAAAERAFGYSSSFSGATNQVVGIQRRID